MIVERLIAARPDHAAFGEEHGLVGDPESPWRWVIDPIDGTSGFVRGIPVWATLIALTHADDGAVLGVVSAPALGRRWWGGVDLGAHVAAFGSTRSMQVSNVVDLAEAQVSVTHSSGWDALGLTPAAGRAAADRPALTWVRRLLAAHARRRGSARRRGRRGRRRPVRPRRAAADRRGGRRRVHRPPRRTDVPTRHGDQHQRPAPSRRHRPPRTARTDRTGRATAMDVRYG